MNKSTERDKSAVLLYMGTGNMVNDVKTYVADKNLQDVVHFLGVRSDIPTILMASDVFLLPSYYEGLPIVLIEAQCTGLPCFASDAISGEAKILDNFQYISLQQGPDYWAEQILKANKQNRENGFVRVTDAGYNIVMEVIKLEQMFTTESV